MEGIQNWFSGLGRSFNRFTAPAVEWFNELTQPIKEFILENTRNPFLWIGLIILGLVVFEFVYQALKKD